MELITSYRDTIVEGEIVETTVLTPVGSPSSVLVSEELRCSLQEAHTGCVSVDLSRLRWLSAKLISALVQGIEALRRRGVAVSVLGLNDRHTRVLGATGLSAVLDRSGALCRSPGVLAMPV
ncbi:MAG: hypothetical protein CME26_13670 [Gemmatimonadetes bacterium]|nr:hypothetical protein [Gemmatimonadota bacterium]|tara:strand:+ start:2252 stop:2614 length:363 start_codon:yes stop_codon:yes gene_type:complete